jgi:hypothetical protein
MEKYTIPLSPYMFWGDMFLVIAYMFLVIA